jgi:hypothetical protein
VRPRQSRRSKAVSGSFKVIIVGIVAITLIKLAPFVAAVLPSVASPSAAGQAVPTELPSRVIKIVEFVDRNRTYRVDLETGRVTFTETVDVIPVPEPTPQPPPTPNPPPPVVVTAEPAWACLFVSPARTDTQWLDSESIRAAAAERGIQYRGYRSTEPEVDELGYRGQVRSNTVPCIVITDKDGKILLSRKVEGEADIVKAIREGK